MGEKEGRKKRGKKQGREERRKKTGREGGKESWYIVRKNGNGTC